MNSFYFNKSCFAGIFVALKVEKFTKIGVEFPELPQSYSCFANETKILVVSENKTCSFFFLSFLAKCQQSNFGILNLFLHLPLVYLYYFSLLGLTYCKYLFIKEKKLHEKQFLIWKTRFPLYYILSIFLKHQTTCEEKKTFCKMNCRINVPQKKNNFQNQRANTIPVLEV